MIRAAALALLVQSVSSTDGRTGRLCDCAIVRLQSHNRTVTQSHSPRSLPAVWSFDAAVATYLFPHDGDYAQPSFTANRGALGLEARFNDVALRAFSAFVGWRFAADGAVALEVTPKLGGAVGTIDAAIPALEFTLHFRRLELASEAQFVIDVHHTREAFFYNWSEISIRTTARLRLGMATQRTRVFEQLRDIQRGILVGVTFGPVDGSLYWFNPDSDRGYVVASVGVSFGG